MPNARIITSDPASSESLGTYLRAQGYEVSYSRPGNPHTSSQQRHSDDLVIAIESCVDPGQALARARELAAQRHCDVFVGEGVLDGLDIERLDLPEPAAATLPVEPYVPAAPQEVIADAEAGNPEPASEVFSEIAPLPAPNSSALPGEETEFESKETITPQEEKAAFSREHAPKILAAHKPSAMKLGWQALRETKRLLAVQLAALLQRTGSMLQLVKMRTAERLEALLLWQQARSAALARRRNEERKSREELRRQAAVKREAAQQSFARRQRIAENKPKEMTAQTIAQRIRAMQAGLHLRDSWKVGRFLPHRTRAAKTSQSKVTPIQPAKDSADQRYSRDWKMVFAGAGVAALLILLVLGVFSGHTPATDHSRTDAAKQQLPFRTVALPPAASRAQAAPLLTIGAAPVTSAPANAVTNTKPVAASRANRTIIEESDSQPEVIVRYFRRPGKRTTSAKTVAGIKHYSDQN